MYFAPPPGRYCGNHAIVTGASIGGLLAARVLSAHFDRVTVLDRDDLPSAAEDRHGVPQGRHGHGLLASGLRGLNRLFPSLEADLLRGGAIPGDVIGNVRWFHHGHYKAKFESGLSGLLLSRPLLEGTIRRHVLQIPNVRVLDRTRVLGLLIEKEGDHGRVSGVRAQSSGEGVRPLWSELVIDASGRASRSAQWLEELGYESAPVDQVAVGIAYTTRIYRRERHHLAGDLGAVIAPTPPRERRIGSILALEGDRWIVSLSGWNGDHAPIEPEGFLEFARSLPRPDIYDVIKDAEPLSEAAYFPFPSNQRRRFERLTRFPAGYLLIGDAMCSFNPLYGQGMSVATLEALALEAGLETPAPGSIWKTYFKAASRIIDGPWTIAVGGDFAFEGVTGTRPPGNKLINWYLGRVHRAASTDRVVCRGFFDVANLLRPASHLFRPGILARVAKDGLRPHRSRPSDASRPDSPRRRMVKRVKPA